MIQAGGLQQIQWNNGHWFFLDIGFAGSKSRTCGFVAGDDPPECLTFAAATHRVVERFTKSETTCNLVLEAPLSVCFDSNGNPKKRRVETENERSRPWYVGPGCVVMVAATYLVRAIFDARPAASILLFEGFISFKGKSSRSDHRWDVRTLREIVRDPTKFPRSVFAADELKEPGDRICSAFAVAGLDCGIPPVIKYSPTAT